MEKSLSFNLGGAQSPDTALVASMKIYCPGIKTKLINMKNS